MKKIEKLILLILIISSFLPHVWGSAMIRLDIDPGIIWYAHRFNAAFTGLLIMSAIITAILMLARKKVDTNPFRFNILDFIVTMLFFGIGSVAAVIGFFQGNPLHYVIGDTYIYFSFGTVYFLSAYFPDKKGVFKIIDYSIYFIFIFMMIPESLYKLREYFVTHSFLVSGIVYYLLPFIYFFSKYNLYPAKKTFYALFASIIAIIITLYRTLAMNVIFVLISYPFLTGRLKKTYTKVIGVVILLVTLVLALQVTNVFPVFGRYDLTYYYHSFFDPDWGDRRDARVTETTSAISALKENKLSILSGKGQGAIADMTNGELYEGVYETGVGEDEFERGKVHSIHFTLASILFRTGVIGLSIYVLFLFFSVLFLYKKNRGMKLPQNRIYSETALLFFLVSILYSFSRYGIVNDLVLAAFLGLARNPNFKDVQ